MGSPTQNSVFSVAELCTLVRYLAVLMTGGLETVSSLVAVNVRLHVN